MKRVFLLGVLICLLGTMTANAQVNSTAKSTSDGKPVVTTLMSKKLAYACRINPQTMGMLLAQSTGAETQLALAWKLELMDEGAPEICEKLLWDLYEITDPLFQENLQSIGFNSYEISLSVKLVTYLKEEKEKQEKALREENQRKLIALQDSLFNAWSRYGVPDDISPNVHATIKCLDTVSFVKYIDSLDLDTVIKYTFYVEIDEHGVIKSAWSYDSHDFLEEILKRLPLQAAPAKYKFNALSKSIDMGSKEELTIYELWEGIATKRDNYRQSSSPITVQVNYNKKKQQCEIVEDIADEELLRSICKREGIEESWIIQELVDYLKQTTYKGKLYITFRLYQRKIKIGQKNCGFIANGLLSPKIDVKNVNEL